MWKFPFPILVLAEPVVLPLDSAEWRTLCDLALPLVRQAQLAIVQVSVPMEAIPLLLYVTQEVIVTTTTTAA